MMTVNGERVWVPRDRQDLVAGLQRMGIQKVAGRPLAQVSIKQLTAAYCSERARIVRRRQQEHAQAGAVRPAATAVQLELLPR
jgi:hypothetical protein